MLESCDPMGELEDLNLVFCWLSFDELSSCHSEFIKCCISHRDLGIVRLHGTTVLLMLHNKSLRGVGDTL